ncbi:hypothetical protein Lalb_Chr14g0371491 [Lupinus albus]|uniref:Uncharacterized protein n=1 Tax=Lupinus albus TaxID=3870 RepID=A0A6A4PFM2_LUPAL|nr:hypothetical protein Lalb_Chr14g0371491 [Lupinus albus]
MGLFVGRKLTNVAFVRSKRLSHSLGPSNPFSRFSYTPSVTSSTTPCQTLNSKGLVPAKNKSLLLITPYITLPLLPITCSTKNSVTMKGTSKVIMGATLVMVFSLVVILALILVLLAELYCSFLLHRRQIRNSNPQTTTTTTTASVFTPSHSPTPHPPHQQQRSPPPPPPPPFTSICSQGVLQPPRSILFPPFSSIHDLAERKKQHQQLSELQQIIPIQTQHSNDNANANSHCIGLVSVPSSLESFMSRAPSKSSQQDSLQGNTAAIDKTCSGGEHLVYISNPIYENEEGKEIEPNTPFQTPDTSPSRLERSGSSSDDYDDDEVEVSHCGVQTLPCTPPLTPMKKLPRPEEACSVSLREAMSLGTSGCDSHSNNALFSSSSASPYTSPSW